MNEFEKLLIDLKEHIEELEKTFIHQFIEERMTEPDEYENHVKAYCVLCHAAIEDYFESIARGVMHRCLNEWCHSRKYTDTLVTLVSYYKQELVIDRNETKVFDSLKGVFNNVKKRFLADVDNNHGISLKYLRRLLIPVAIDIKEDANLKNSLNRLARERGEYAHKRLIRHILVPEDAKSYVEDCLELCEDVKVKAENKFIQVFHPFTSHATLKDLSTYTASPDP